MLVLSDLWPPFPGGAERLAFNLARHLAESMTVQVVTGYEYPQQFDGPPVAQSLDGLDVAAVVDEHRPFVVMTHHWWAFQHAEALAATGLPVVQLVLNGNRLPCADLAVYISRWVREQDPTQQPSDLTITPPVFNDVIAEEHGDAIGFIKPIPHKGVELFYRIAERLPDRKFVVLRGEWQTLETIRTDLPNVEFMEPVDDIRDFWRRVRVVLVPSHSEDAGTVAQEATMNGVPCLSSNVQGLRETNGGGARLPTSSVMRWVQAIRRLDDPRRYAAAVEAQRRHLARVNQDSALATFTARVGELAS